MKKKDQAPDSTVLGYLPGYLSATVVSLLRKWVESGYRQTPEQVGELASKLISGYAELTLPKTTGKAESTRSESISDILNNIPTGVCVLFMPDETHQEIRFANTQQMRLINHPCSEASRCQKRSDYSHDSGCVCGKHSRSKGCRSECIYYEAGRTGKNVRNAAAVY